MDHRIVLRVTAVTALFFGLVEVFATQQFAAFYHTEFNVAGTYNTQLFGATLLGIAVMDWLVSKAITVAEIQPIIIGNWIVTVLGFLITLFQQIRPNSELDARCWLNVAIYLILACGFSYVLLAQRRRSHDAAPSHLH